MNEINERKELLLSVMDVLTGSVDINEVLQKSVDIVVKDFGYESAVSFENSEEAQKVYSRTYTNGFISKYAVSFIEIPFNKLFVEYKDEENYVVQTVLTKKVKQSNNLGDFIIPVVSESMADVLQIVGRVKYIVTLPIIVNGKVFGALMVVKSKTRKFDNEELDFLKSYTESIATAIKKFDKSKD
jgi:GAF domain-containing protein